MSIRIQNESSSSTAAAPSSRADELSRVSVGNAKSRSHSLKTTDDTVEISAFSENIAAANHSQSVHDAGKIQKLAALYRKGSYQLDSRELSQSLVSNAVGSARTQGDG